MPTRAIETTDGRTLNVHDDGDPAGRAIVVHHGTPGSGLPYTAHERLAREQGVRLIGYDRPGYGESVRAPGRAVADAAADVEAIADALGIDRFASWGISGGGPHALACAALSGERLVAAAALASPAPFAAEGLDWLAGMGEANLDEFAAASAGETALRPYLETERTALVAAEPDELRDTFMTLLGDADRAVLGGGIATHLVESARDGLRAGVDGWLDDDIAFVEPWGFDPAAVARPTLLVHGEDDRFVPAAHGRWLASRIPRVEARITGDDGHLTLIEHRVRDAHDWLLARF